jgi:hypothetical protein
MHGTLARATIVAAGIALAAPALADPNLYAVRNLVSDVPGAAEQLDPDLVNPWASRSTPTASCGSSTITPRSRRSTTATASSRD